MPTYLSKGELVAAKIKPYPAPHTLEDAWALETQLGVIYLINAARYIQGITGIYPYHADEHMQQWLLACLQKPMQAHWAHLGVVELKPVQQVPKDLFYAYLQHPLGINAYFAAPQTLWLQLFKRLTLLRKLPLDVTQFPLNLEIVLGRTQLPYLQYKKLQPGDMIRLQTAYFNTAGTGVIAMGAWQMRIDIQDDEQISFNSWEENSMKNTYEDDDELEYEVEDEDEDEADAALEDEDIDDALAMDDEDDAEDDDAAAEDEDDDAATSMHSTKKQQLNQQLQQLDQQDLQTQKKWLPTDDEVNSTQQQTQADVDADIAAIDANNETALPFKTLKVNVDFSLGRLRLRIDELMNLSEGAILPLQKKLPAQVTLYANQKPIAVGEVVSIEDALAVRIIEFIKTE